MSGFLQQSRAPDRYDPRFIAQLIERLNKLESLVYLRGRDVEIPLPLPNSGGRGPRLILVSPDGTRYSVTVDNAGVIGTVAV